MTMCMEEVACYVTVLLMLLSNTLVDARTLSELHPGDASSPYDTSLPVGSQVVYPLRRLGPDGSLLPPHSPEHYLRRSRRRRSAAGQPPPAPPSDNTGSESEQESSERHYAFTAFDTDLELELRHDANFISPNLVVERVGLNSSRMWIRQGGDNQHCFYSGKVKGDPWSRVSLSVCDHMIGSIFAFNEHFLIEAHPNVTRLDDVTRRVGVERAESVSTRGVPHIIYRASQQRPAASPVATDSEGSAEGREVPSPSREYVIPARSTPYSTGKGRQRREAPIYRGGEENYMELMVVADAEMEAFYGDDLDHYIFVLMGQVAGVYKNHTLENNINIVVKRVVVLESHDAGPRVSTNAASTLRNFCLWQRQQNVARESSPLHHDTAVLITKKNICRNTMNCETLGLAETGTLCDTDRSCSIAEDNGLSTAFTIAHELGHVLSLPHDDDKRCEKYPGTARGVYHLMAPTLDYTTNPWSWSDCSAGELTAFLHSPSAHCLHNEPPRTRPQYLDETKSSQVEQPGELYGVNTQCEQAYGMGSQLCPYTHEMYNEIHANDFRCTRLWCTNVSPTGDDAGCRTQHMPWADGTKCGNNMWCIMGQCVRRRPLVATDGGWSDWVEYGECSRTCGGGVKKSIRKCNNPPPKHGGKYCKGENVRYLSCNTGPYLTLFQSSWKCNNPPPKHGGKYCKGENVRYLSCNTGPCPSGGMDTFRDEQCAKYNGNNQNILGLPADVKWNPMYTGIPAKDRCKLFCQANTNSAFYFPLEAKVVDGTKCDQDSSDVCINGICVPAGCDNVLGSNKKRDQCGVCDGDGTLCDTVKHTFNQRLPKERFGYNQVAAIPKGASNILIEQYGYNGSKDDHNYLALMDSDGNFLLNGHYIVTVHRKRLLVKGSVLEYSGSDHVIEVINATRQIEESLILMLLTVGEMHPANITYSYTIVPSESIKFRWVKRLEDCHSTCGAGREKAVKCMRTPDRQVVSDHYCERYLDPKPETEPDDVCPSHCTLSWRLVHESNCSAACGAGFVTRRYQCFRTDPNTSTLPLPVESAECERFVGAEPQTQWPCTGICLSPEWSYGEWSKCTRSCGGGHHYRMATCRDSLGRVRAHEECDPSARLIIQRCNAEDCPAWATDNWGQCSTSCGEGVQQRHLWCKQGEVTVSKTLCETQPEPARTRPCEANPPCATWRVGRWGECSTTCGNTIKTRDVRCVTSAGEELPDNQCNVNDKPTRFDICYQPACTTTPTTTSTQTTSTTTTTTTTTHRPTLRPTPSFSAQVFSSSVLDSRSSSLTLDTAPAITPKHDENAIDTSGSLAKSSSGKNALPETARTVYERTGELGERVVDSAEVTHSHGVPRTTEVQSVASWRTGSWTQCSVTCGTAQQYRCCSVTCGTGQQYRYVSCRDRQGRGAPESACSSAPRPPSRQYCTMAACGQWRTGEWMPCPVQCGGGTQTRFVACVTSSELHERVASSSECDVSARPDAEQVCNTHECASERHYEIDSISTNRVERTAHWRVGVWGECSVTCGGGWQRRAVACMVERGMSVDCDPEQEPEGTRQCNTLECPIWRSGDWGQCSQSCDGGLQYRMVVCQLPSGGDHLDPAQCDLSTRPTGSNVCSTRPCEQPAATSQNQPEPPASPRQPASSKEQERDGSVVTSVRWFRGAWSQCSVTCGRGGRRSRRVECQSEAGLRLDDSLCLQSSAKPKSVRRCRRPLCPEWKTHEWGECSANCAQLQGVRTRLVECAAGNQVVAHAQCAHLPRPPATSECSANVEACGQRGYLWRPGPWSQCSVTCGKGGHKIRHIECQNEAGLPVESELCVNMSMPKSSRRCRMDACPKWRTYRWSQCWAPCGNGLKSRRVECVGASRQPLPSHQCAHLQTQPTTANCTAARKTCTEQYVWHTGPWSSCLSSCGPGRKERAVLCAHAQTGAPANESQCPAHSRPSVQRACMSAPCPNTWLASEWSQCSASCGEGTQSRHVTCHDVSAEGWLDTDHVSSACDVSSRPAAQRRCVVAECGAKYSWSVSPWKQCSAECGLGTQRRRLQCVDLAGKPVPSRMCPRRHRPAKSKACYNKPCYASSCKNLQELAHITSDGEYRLLIENQLVQIYCEKMQRSVPREFLTLPATPQQNFAKIFHKRLKEPAVAPCPAAEAAESCDDCVLQSDYREAGLTLYTRVRLNLTALAVITSDGSLGESEPGGRQISWGEAGDCFSALQCPQGEFQINLSGTSFQISAQTQWEAVGNHTSVDIRISEDRQLVYGRCGGRCGHCKPAQGLVYLSLLPNT